MVDAGEAAVAFGAAEVLAFEGLHGCQERASGRKEDRVGGGCGGGEGKIFYLPRRDLRLRSNPRCLSIYRFLCLHSLVDAPAFPD